MKEKEINIAELLKDCPKGTEFYSRCIGVVKFESIDNTLKRIIVKNEREIVSYKENGVYYYADENAEIDLFPSKDQRDWSKWQKPFKDGDVVTYKLKGSLVAFIYKERTSTMLVKSHFALYIQNMGFCIDGDIALKEEDIVFATEEEKQKLFKAIKDNGYKWNEQTKTLEKVKKNLFEL